jgi:hypothetical protein
MIKRVLVLTLGMCVACGATGPGDESEGDGPLAEAAALDATAAAAKYSRAELDAKIFGYMFADGNFFTDDTTHLPNPSYFGGAVPVTKDIVSLACKAGYAVKLGGQMVDCASQPNTNGAVMVMAFRYPHGANLDNMTDPKELRAFFSGVLIGEGSRAGQVDDQFPNYPAGHYTTEQEVIDHISLVQRALERTGFSSAHLTGKSGAACSGLKCREAWINVKTEGCEFAAAYGYTFVSWRRVPGATVSGTDYVGPAPCK